MGPHYKPEGLYLTEEEGSGKVWPWTVPNFSRKLSIMWCVASIKGDVEPMYYFYLPPFSYASLMRLFPLMMVTQKTGSDTKINPNQYLLCFVKLICCFPMMPKIVFVLASSSSSGCWFSNFYPSLNSYITSLMNVSNNEIIINFMFTQCVTNFTYKLIHSF